MSYSPPYPYRVRLDPSPRVFSIPAGPLEPLADAVRAVLLSRSVRATIPTSPAFPGGAQFATAPPAGTTLTFRGARRVDTPVTQTHTVLVVGAYATPVGHKVPEVVTETHVVTTFVADDPIGTLSPVIGTLADVAPGAAVLVETTETLPSGDRIWRFGLVTAVPDEVQLPSGKRYAATLRAAVIVRGDLPEGKDTATRALTTPAGHAWFDFTGDRVAGGIPAELGTYPTGAGAVMLETDPVRGVWTLATL